MRSIFCFLLVTGLFNLSTLAQQAEPKSTPSNESQQQSEEAAVRKISELTFHQGHDLTCVTSARETGDSKQGPAVALLKFEPGCIIPWHWHSPNENVMVLDGTLQQEWKGHETQLAKHGDFIHIPSHQINRAKCISDTPCMLYLYSDAVFDMHYVDSAGKEITSKEAIGADPSRP